jgi:hypothetical protein
MLKETRGRILGNLVHYGVLPLTSIFRYSPFGIKPIPTLQAADDKKEFNLTIVFAENDTSVGTNPKLRDQLIEVLKTFGLRDGNIAKNVLYVPGGHSDFEQQQALLRIIVDKIIGSDSEKRYW